MSQPTSERAAISQKGGNRDQGIYKKTYDKKYRKTKICFKCGKEGPPASHCKEVNKKDGQKKEHGKSDDKKSRSNQSSKSSKSDISRLKIQMKNNFTTMEANIDELVDE